VKESTFVYFFSFLAFFKKSSIRVEGFNTRPLGRLKNGIKPRIQIPYENNIPRPFRAGLLITPTAGFLPLIQYISHFQILSIVSIDKNNEKFA
jgi:hypothetical protein